MEATGRQKYIVMSPRKIRRVTQVIQGKPVSEAYNILRLMPYDAARVVLKKLIEVSHNASVKFGAQFDNMVVSRAFADEATHLRRVRPRAQGRMYKREKPMAHLTIHVQVKEAAAQ